MKARAVVATMLLLIMSMASAFATVRIQDDSGGQIGEYLARYQALRVSGDQVVIDGTCAPACTMLLGTIPRNRICVTPRAVLAFHSAWDPTSGGNVASGAGNQILWSNYPSNVRKWISRNGGLRSRIIYLRGARIVRHVPDLSLISRERSSVAQLVSRIAIIACAPTVRLIGHVSSLLCRGYLGWIVISTAAPARDGCGLQRDLPRTNA